MAGRGAVSAGPLAGVRVIDLSPTRVGAQVTQTLADFGADVVWVEPPGGSGLRSQSCFPFLARGKRSVVADLTSPRGVRTVGELAESADVLVETFRPGTAERLGVGYGDLAATNPGLVYASITGFGRKGPWSHIKGYEGVVGAVVGLNASFSRMCAGQRPPFVSVPWCSFSASQTALHGILAALHERAGSGHGQWVETNMAQSFTALDCWAWYQYLVGERWPGAYVVVEAVNERGIPNSYMTLTLLTCQTKDGRWMQFAQNSPRLFEALLGAMGLGEMLTDPAWAGIPRFDDEERRAELWRRMLEAARSKTLAEWNEVFASSHDVYAELYRDGPEVLDHPQLAETGLCVELVDPERGPVRQPGLLVHMSSSPGSAATPAPTLGSAGSVTWEPRAAPAAPAPSGRLPLEGVTVLEMAVLYAAPFGATLLADLGARVIKIEQLAGDPVRPMAGFPEAGSAKPTQGKECIAVDVAVPEGREIVHRLAARADAVLEGYRDGAAERLGVDAPTLLAINPDLVYLSGHGYGVGGPCGDRPAFAPSIGAAGGIGAANLGEGIAGPCHDDILELGATALRVSGAVTSRYATADGFAALGVATALLLGLVASDRGAGGQHLASSMLHTVAHALADHVVDFPGSPGGLAPGAGFRGPHALYRIYDAADGWVFLAAPQDDEWDALAAIVELGDDARFATRADRLANDGALAARLAEVFATRAKDVWEEELAAADVACVAVNTGDLEALFTSEAGRSAGWVVEAHHPTFGEHPRVAPLVRFSRSATQALGGSLLGSATDAVLAELGYGKEEIDEMRERKVIA